MIYLSHISTFSVVLDHLNRQRKKKPKFIRKRAFRPSTEDITFIAINFLKSQAFNDCVNQPKQNLPVSAKRKQTNIVEN